MKEAFRGLEMIREESPDPSLAPQYEAAYQHWKNQLEKNI